MSSELFPKAVMVRPSSCMFHKITCGNLFGLGESNGLVVVVEDRVIFSHKDVSQNPLGAGRRNVEGHKGKQTNVLRLDDGLVSGNGIFGSANGEDNVRQIRNLCAINGVFSHNVGGRTDGLGQLGDLGPGSGDQRGSGIDNARDFSVHGVAARRNRIEGNFPVGGRFELDIFEIALELGRIVSSKGQFAIGVVSHIECKDGLIDLVLFDGFLKNGRYTTNTDAGETHSQDAVKLSNAVGHAKTAGVANFGKFDSVEDNVLTNGDGVLGEKSLHATASVHDFEFLPIGFIRRRLGIVVLTLVRNKGKSTVCATDLRNPQVRRSRVENHLEGLGRSSDFHNSKVLGVSIVLDDGVFAFFDDITPKVAALGLIGFGHVQDSEKGIAFTLQMRGHHFLIGAFVHLDAGRRSVDNRRGHQRRQESSAAKELHGWILFKDTVTIYWILQSHTNGF
mmetsp:Transcript_13919/g.28717  ORF Transcript_13919/g.28717 Transcript_13919/m.28717 type:complete len:449 (+) Transcript_13919:62-1408(+)